MKPALEEWLARRFAVRRRNTVMVSGVGMLVGVIITFLTFWFIYALVWFVAHGIKSISHGFFGINLRITQPWRLGATGSFMALVLIDTLRRSASYTEEYPRQRYFPWLTGGGAFGALAQLLRHPQESSTMIVSLLETGPRLFFGCCSLIREAMRLRIDWQVCSPVIELLAGKPHAVLWEELYRAFPEIDWDSAGQHLRGVGGVVFLEKGLSLSEGFRDEIEKA